MATPSFNPLVGWTSNDGALMGWNGQQNSFGGVGKDDGYNGQVDNWADFGKALGWGAGAVFGGPLAAALAIGNMVVGANTGTSPSTLNSLKQGAISLGWMDPSTPTMASPGLNLAGMSSDLSGGGVNANALGGFGAGDLAGSAQNGLNGIGDITGGAGDRMAGGGPSFEGPDIGAQGDATAEGRGWASGGFTGGQEGQPRGTVHGQELVLSAPLVRALGPVAGELDAMNALAAPRQGSGPRSWAEMIMMRHPEAWG